MLTGSTLSSARASGVETTLASSAARNGAWRAFLKS